MSRTPNDNDAAERPPLVYACPDWCDYRLHGEHPYAETLANGLHVVTHEHAHCVDFPQPTRLASASVTIEQTQLALSASGPCTDVEGTDGEPHLSVAGLHGLVSSCAPMTSQEARALAYALNEVAEYLDTLTGQTGDSLTRQT